MDTTEQSGTARRAGELFRRLVEIMQRLRAPDGCPWDREQTLHTLRPFVLEETYEVLEAIDRNDPAALQGEIGDLVFEGVFLAQICAEVGRFTIADALQGTIDKLVRRHPHVFGEAAGPGARSPGEVLEQWEEIKSRERAASGQTESLLGGVPVTLPALLRAHEIGTRVAAVGFDWSRPADVIDKIEEEVAELRQAFERDEGRRRTAEEMGDLLFSIANLCRKLGIEPESALRQANAKFAGRFGALERRLHDRGISLQTATLEEMEAEWRQVKD
jgi:nucleoside triphosphate diphosphatase